MSRHRIDGRFAFEAAVPVGGPRSRSGAAAGGARRALVAGVLLGAAIVSTLSARAQVSAAPAGANEAEIAAAVRALGESAFADREKAAARLRAIGLPALEALRAAKGDADPEIRFRVRRLLDVIEQRDLERRLAEFLQDGESAADDVLPGWKTFRDRIGSDRTCRELFVAMQRAEPTIFRALGGANGGRAVLQAVEERLAEYQFLMQNGITPQDRTHNMAALLFGSIASGTEMPEQSGFMLVNLVNQADLQSALRGPLKDPVRRLVGTWIALPNASVNVTYQQMMLALQHEIPEGTAPAVRVLQQNGVPYYRQYGLLTLGRLGTRGDLPTVEKLFADKTLVAGMPAGKPGFRAEVRDVALAVALHLTGQPLEGYGYKNLQKQPMFLYQPNSLGFADEAARNSAFAKWTEWRKTHPDTAAPNVPPKTDPAKTGPAKTDPAKTPPVPNKADPAKTEPAPDKPAPNGGAPAKPAAIAPAATPAADAAKPAPEAKPVPEAKPAVEARPAAVAQPAAVLVPAVVP